MALKNVASKTGQIMKAKCKNKFNDMPLPNVKVQLAGLRKLEVKKQKTDGVCGHRVDSQGN